MSSLSSLIVQREIATIRQVEEALARQVLYGGDLVTNLLEVTPMDEWQIAAIAAESVGLEAAPSGILPPPESHAHQVIPAELAVRRSMIPLVVGTDRVVIAVSEPLAKEEEEQLSFALGVRIEQRYALYPRLREALAKYYGAPLDRRLERLIARLAGLDSRFPSSRPGLLQDAPIVEPPPRPASVPPYRLSPAFGVPATRPDEPPDTDESPPQVLMPPSSPAVPPPPRAPTTNAGFPAPVFNLPATVAAPVNVPAPASRTTNEFTNEPAPTIAAPPPVPTFVKETSNAVRPMRRRRGPLTFEVAQEELKAAADRDALLDLFFEFARQFFDYAALFIAHGDVVEGRDAFGHGTSRERVVGIGVPFDVPSMFSRARDAKEAVFFTASDEGADGILLNDLGRHPGASAMVLPVLVRTRAVALFFGDGGGEELDHAALADVLAFGKMTGQAFERLIVKRKLGGFTAGAPDSEVGRVVEALPLPPKKHGSSRPPKADAAFALGRAVLAGAKKSEPPPAPRAAAPESERPGSFRPLAVVERVTALQTLPDIPAARRSLAPVEPIHAHLPLVVPAPRHAPSKPPPPELDVRPLSGPAIPREEPDEEPLPLVESSRPSQRRHSSPALESEAMSDDETAAFLAELGQEGLGHDEQDELAIESEDSSSPNSMAFGPRRPPAAHRPEELPSIMVDIDQELQVLVDRVGSGKDPEGQAEAELLRQGANALPAIMSRFPGPLAFARADLAEPLPRARDCGPLLHHIALQRRVALPYVLEEMRSGDSARRFWATFLLTELPYSAAVAPLIPRLYDADTKVRMVARAAARTLAETANETLLAELSRTLRDSQTSRSARLGILEALGELREPLCVPVLIGHLTDSDAEVQMAARRSLIAVTRQDFALEAKPWLAWWGQNSQRHRVEWLIDALEGETPALRKAASDELKALTKQTFGYYDDLPRRERERVQQKFRDWWASDGKARFVRG